MPTLELVVIGASAGGLEALLTIVRTLPADAPAIIVVVHTSPSSPTFLPEILQRVSSAPVALAQHNQPIRPGRILVAPPDVHVLVSDGRVVLSHGPRENGFRPAIDPLFRSAARDFGSRVMAIILSGALNDGTYGMKVVKDAGGVTVVQDPEEAAIPSMPSSVLAAMAVDHVRRAQDIGGLIMSLASGRRSGARNARRSNDPEPQDPAKPIEVEEMQARYGPPSGLTCPDCGGALWEIAEDNLHRHRCHVGHQFSTEALEASQHDAVESALWTAVRVLEEHAAMKQRMAERAGGAGLETVRHGFLSGADDSRQQARAIRDVLFNRRSSGPADTASKRQRKTRSRTRRPR